MNTSRIAWSVVLAVGLMIAGAPLALPVLAAEEGPELFNKLFPVCDPVGWDFINQQGEPVIQRNFSYACDFSEGLAFVSDGPGYTNEKGVIVCPLDDLHVYVPEPRLFSEGLVAIRVAGKCGFVDRNGKVAVAPKYAEVGDFSEGLARVS